jgi:hypothetical protein
MSDRDVESNEIKVIGRDPSKRQVNMTFSDGDIELLEWACDYLRCSKSELMRSALRSHVQMLQSVSRTMRV